MIDYIHEQYFIRRVSDILAEEGCEFSYNVVNNKIYTYEGYDATKLLLALFEHFDRLQLEKWKEKFSADFGVPMSMLFPAESIKKKKYTFSFDRKPKVYISGKVTGLPEKEYKNNFNSAELWLTGLGYDVVNPVSYDEIPNGTWEQYMRRDIKLLCSCDYIYLLDGWQDSEGAILEKLIAGKLKIKTLELDDNGKVL